MTTLTDTERETLLAKVIARRMTWGSIHWTYWPERDLNAAISKAIVADGWRHADELAVATTAATLAERERLLGVFVGKADHIHECAQAVVNRDDRSLGLKSGYQQSASALRTLINQERAR